MSDQTKLPDAPADGKTRYMVLFAPQPDPGEPIKWRELGWYDAHSEQAAKVMARDDEASGVYGQLLDIAGGPGLRMRAVAKRSWREDEEVFVIERSWSTKPASEPAQKEAE